MPVITPRYRLTAFARGDQYSAITDQSRMKIIDQHLAFLADRVGDGRITGWEVSIENLSQREIAISSGIGVIDRFVTRTFNDYTTTLANNSTSYLYMRRRNNMIGGFSGFSNTASYTYTDSTAPATPTGLAATSPDYQTAELTWTSNSEIDLDHYTIWRGLNASELSEIDTSTTNSYTDDDVEQNVTYYYKIDAVDKNDNTSAATSVVFIKIKTDLRVPLNPGFVYARHGNESIQLVWDTAQFDPVQKYEIRVQKLNSESQPIGDITVISKLSTATNHIIKNLENEVAYRVTIFTVGVNDVYSDGVSVTSIPTRNDGPVEVDEINVSFTAGNSNDNVVMHISWTPNSDPYVAPVSKFTITIIENGTDQSLPITVIDSYDRIVSVISFNSGAFRSVKANTNYTVVIQSVDEDSGKSSNGAVFVTKSPSFVVPSPPTSLFITELVDKTIVAQWINSSTSLFSHNLLTLTITDTETDVVETIENSTNVGIANNHVLSDNFAYGKEYEFSIVAVDIFGNQSTAAEATYTTASIVLTDLPKPPDGQDISAGDGQIKLIWNESSNPLITYYKIWRAPFALFYQASNFTLIDTIPSSIVSYSDFTVTNGSTYTYFLTSVDTFGRESLNPADDGFFSYPLRIAKPQASSYFNQPSNLAVAVASNDVTLTWDAPSGEFNGYEIFRANNKYSFSLIGYVDASITTYIDEDVLLDNGTYYYLIRTFTNEANPFITESTVEPSGATLIAKITITDGDIDIDESVAFELQNLEDVIKDAATERINSHKHKKYTIVKTVPVTSWTTSDNTVYTTTVSLSGANSFIVKIVDSNGNLQDSPIPYTVDVFNKTVTFRRSLLDHFGRVTSMILQLIGQDRRINLSDKVTLDDWNWTTTDYRTYSTTEDISGASSYNVRINGQSTNLLYEIDSVSNTITFEKILYSTALDANPVFSSIPTISVDLVGVAEVDGTLPARRVGNLDASVLSSGLIQTIQMSDIEHEGRMKEILIPVTNAMTTTDYINYTLSSGTSFNASLTFYDIISIPEEVNHLLAATSKGLLKSNDFGSSWESVGTTNTAPHRLFYSDDMSTCFALTNKRVYYSTGDFTQWTSMRGIEAVQAIRDIAEDELGNVYISTNLGVYKLNIDNYTTFFQWEYTDFFGPRSTDSFALYFDNNRLLVGNDMGLLESSNHGLLWSFSSEFSRATAVYQIVSNNGNLFAITDNEVWRKNGSNDFVKISELDVDKIRRISIFNERIYITTSIGLIISDTGVDIHSDSTLDFVSTLPQMNINGIAAPVVSLSTLDQNLFIGTEKKLYYIDSDNKLWLQHEDTVETPSIFVDDVLQKVGFRYNNSDRTVSFDNKIKRQVDVNGNEVNRVKVTVAYNKYIAENKSWHLQDSNAVVVLRVNGIEVGRSDDTVNTLTALGITVDPRTGTFTATTEYNKFDSLEADILDVTLSNSGENTHREIEDAMEYVNSGLPSMLSRVKQVNLTKLGIFTEKTWPGIQATRSGAYNAQYIIPRSHSDYDSFDSTVDHDIHSQNNSVSNVLCNVSANIYLSDYNRVLVGGYGHLLSIDTINLDISEINIVEDELIVRDFYEKPDGTLMMLTNYRVYESDDGGDNWLAVDRTGLPNSLYSLGMIKNSLIVGASDGVYIKLVDQTSWTKQLSTTNYVSIMVTPDIGILVADGVIKYTSNGIDYTSLTSIDSQVKDIIKHRNLFFIATDQGLYYDNGTFYGKRGSISAVDVAGDLDTSQDMSFNSLASSGTKLVSALSDGTYYVREYDAFTLNDNTNLSTIHKIMFVGDDIWLFGGDAFRVPSITLPIKLTTGAPI